MDIHNSGRRKAPFCVTTTIIVIGMLMLVGCGDDNPADSSANQDIDEVVISPDSASFAAGEMMDFSAVALTAEGDTVRDVNFIWKSSDPDVFTVQDNGTATGQAPGTAYCGVGVPDESPDKKLKLVPIGLDSATVHIF